MNYSQHGIPEVYIKPFEFQEKHDALKIRMQNFLANRAPRKWCLYFYGPSGSGKTHLAISAMFAWLHEGKRSCEYLTPYDYIQTIKSLFGNSVEEANYVDAICNRELLIIDDFGMNRITGQNDDLIYNLVDKRHKLQKKTIFTSNISPGEIKKVYGDRVWRRINEGNHIEFAEPYQKASNSQLVESKHVQGKIVDI